MGRPRAGFTLTHTVIKTEERWLVSYTLITDVIFPLEIWSQLIGISDDDESTRVLEDRGDMPSQSSKKMILLASNMSSHSCM
jgi:hypothetical protein